VFAIDPRRTDLALEFKRRPFGNNIEAVRNEVKGYAQSYTGRRIAFKRTWLEG